VPDAGTNLAATLDSWCQCSFADLGGVRAYDRCEPHPRADTRQSGGAKAVFAPAQFMCDGGRPGAGAWDSRGQAGPEPSSSRPAERTGRPAERY
jgi:hypothetical protein